MAFSSYTPTVVYPADGTTTTFAIPDKFYDSADVHVFLVSSTGVENELDQGDDYDVVITAIDQTPPARKTGNAVLNNAPATGIDVVIFLWPKSDQDQSYEGRIVTPRQNERVQDRHSMRDAALREFFVRGFRAPLNTPPGLRYIVIGDEGAIPIFDASGNLVTGPTVGEVAAVSEIADSINTVAAVSTEISSVAGISSDVTTVAANIADVVAAAANIADLADKLNKDGGTMSNGVVLASNSIRLADSTNPTVPGEMKFDRTKGDFYVFDGSTAIRIFGRSSGAPHAILEDQKSSSTNGGSAVAGINTRTLNTKVVDLFGFVTLSSNQFVVSENFYAEFEAPAVGVGQHKALLYNVTDAVYEGFGSSEQNATSISVGTYSKGVVHGAAGKTYELRQRCNNALASTGLGQATGGGERETYSRVKIWRR